MQIRFLSSKVFPEGLQLQVLCCYESERPITIIERAYHSILCSAIVVTESLKLQVLLQGVLGSSQTSQKRNTGSTYSIAAAISFKIVSLRTYTAIPLFSPRFQSTLEVILLDAVKYRLQFPLYIRHFFKTFSLQFNLQFGKQTKSQGPKSGRNAW